MKPVCVIYDKDIHYGKHLLQALCKRENLMFDVSLFTDEEAFAAYMKEQSPQLLLVSEEVYAQFPQIQEHHVVLLVSEEERILSENNSQTCIYKYQSVEGIVREIIACMGQKSTSGKRTNILGVYSLDSQDMQTMFALDLAKTLSEHGKTLYVNLEEFSALEEVLPAKEDKTLSDAFYYFRQAKLHVNEKVTDCICSVSGVDYFAPVVCADDIALMGYNEFVQFLTGIGEQEAYCYIVLDFGSAVAGQWKYMRMCDRTYLLAANNSRAKKRVECFEKYLLLSGLEEQFNRIQRVDIPQMEITLDADYLFHFEGKGMNGFVREMLADG